MSDENWKDIAEYLNYQISSLGRVKSKERTITDSIGRTRRISSRILKQGDSMGYSFVNLVKNGEINSIKVHVLVAEAFLGQRPDGCDVCHKNGNKKDNIIDNLEYGTRSKNNLDNYRINGCVTKNQKLTVDEVKEIKKQLQQGVSQRKLALKYGVCKSTIAAIKTKELYGWIGEDVI
jgi:DNA-binding transcriptional regulator YiaG